MKLITVDGKEWQVKYMQNKESISNATGTTVSNFPGFVGSKLNQNSTGSDKYAINLTVHESLLVSFKASLNKFVTDEAQAVNNPVYGKLLNIVLEHTKWGALQGKIIGDISYNTAKNGDIPVSFTFQEHTADEPQPKRDFETENQTAIDNVDFETTENYTDLEISANDKTAMANFLDKLNGIYANIQNSAIVSAFNDANAALNATLLDSKRIMNTTKKIIALPNNMISTTSNKLKLFTNQANEIKTLPVTSLNIAKFNMNCFAFNVAQTSKTAFNSGVVESSGVKVQALP